VEKAVQNGQAQEGLLRSLIAIINPPNPVHLAPNEAREERMREENRPLRALRINEMPGLNENLQRARMAERPQEEEEKVYIDE
jgi:hypothetical protein